VDACVHACIWAGGPSRHHVSACSRILLIIIVSLGYLRELAANSLRVPCNVVLHPMRFRAALLSAVVRERKVAWCTLQPVAANLTTVVTTDVANAAVTRQAKEGTKEQGFTSHSTPNRSFRRRHAPSTCCCYRIHIAIAGAVVDEIACTDGIHDKDFSAAARGDCCGNYCTVNIRVVYICFASWLICRPSPSPS